jgi:phosphoglycolate phosphatase-like HAD superfamily hydrolase
LSPRLILFDIDGTLVASNLAGRRVMSQALHDIFGNDGMLQTTSFAGKTDQSIIYAAMSAVGVPEPELLGALPLIYKAMEKNGQHTFSEESLVPCTGVLPLLAELRANPQVILGLQTANIRSTALQKLLSAGLDPAWFMVGAFGCESPTREGLFPIAWQRARQLTEHHFSGHNTVVVGDTPGDVMAARSKGALVLAVASGFSEYSELARCEPDYLVADLSETETIMSFLLGNR